MYKFLFFLVFFSPSSLLKAQRHFFTGVSFGATKYYGDLGKTSLFQQVGAAGGISAIAELNHRMLVRAELNFGKVNGCDRYDAKTVSRNLSFQSNITEVALEFEYILFDLYEYKLSPYVFAGISTFKFSPYTNNQNGQAVFLAEQSTEGQGFYAGRKPYKLNQQAIPFGGGAQWVVSNNFRIALELGIRKTFTDYLDDVSTTYVNPTLLAQQRGGTAVSLAYRGMELPNASPYPAEGTLRGNPKTKDWFLISGIHFRFSLNPKPRQKVYRFRPVKARTGCPSGF